MPVLLACSSRACCRSSTLRCRRMPRLRCAALPGPLIAHVHRRPRREICVTAGAGLRITLLLFFSQATSGGSQRSGQTNYSASPPALTAAPVSDVLPYAPRPPMDWSLRTRLQFASSKPLRLCEDATLASGA